MPPLIYKLKRDGRAQAIEFNWDLQYAEDPSELVSIATQYGASMSQGYHGYIEVWVDDESQYRCQATDYVVGKPHAPHEFRDTTEVNIDSLLVGNSADAKEWVTRWWKEVSG